VTAHTRYFAVQRTTMSVIGLHHAGVHVASLERSIAFYQTVFGLSVAERLTLGGEQLAFLQAGGSRIELISDGAGPRDTGVVDHLALEVDNLDAWLMRLSHQSVRLLDPTPVDVPQLGARILFCLGPDGERIELFERRPPGSARPVEHYL
jgi:catechol 2,3-dioxygenase-like lactoylglutathione lyase family enzyme